MKPNVWKVVLEEASLLDIAEILEGIADELAARNQWLLAGEARNTASRARHYGDAAPPPPSAPSVTDQLPTAPPRTGVEGRGW